MIWVGMLVLALGALLLSGFFSGSETGLYCVDRVRLHLLAERGAPGTRRLARLLEDEQGTLAVSLLGTNLMNYLLTAAVTYLLARQAGLADHDAEIYTVVLVTPIVFVFGEVVPKNLYQAHADVLMRYSAPLLVPVSRLSRVLGLVWLLKRLTAIVLRCLGIAPDLDEAFAPKRRVTKLLREALSPGTHGEEQSDLVERVLNLSSTRVHQVMVPRDQVVTVAAGADRRQLIALARRTRHSCVAVYDDRRRYIIGLVKVDSLLQRDDWQRVDEDLRPITRLRPHDTVAAALSSMRRDRYALAVVTDQGGRMLGIVTLKDLLEEVVGELEDW